MKIAIAVTGASGAIYAKVLLDQLLKLKEQTEEVALVFSNNAHTVWDYELEKNGHKKYPFKIWSNDDFMAPFASGSASYAAMIIIPCSMGIIGRIANGISNDLITRSADVMLKERRKLICVVREAPYNLLHLRNMTQLTEAGAIIVPASPSFYSKPQTIEEVVSTITNRALQLAGLHIDGYKWQEVSE